MSNVIDTTSSVHHLIRNAKVEVEQLKDKKGHDIAAITVNDQYYHEFSHKSRVSKHLELMTTEQLQNRLDGGTYFFVEDKTGFDQLVDWRDGHYHGFIHTDDNIHNYMDLLGFVHKEDLQYAHNRKENDQQILLRSSWNKTEITVPGYVAAGGDFHSELSFVWNPFVSHINSSFELVRQICTNGMIGITSFLNTKIPLLNRETEHLDIAARQIQNKVSSIVVDRVQIMSDERASVGQLLLLKDHILDRLITTIEASEHNRLLGLLNAVSPEIQLAHVYKNHVFENKDLAAQVPSHLTLFDAWNVATEVRSHTTPTKKSSDTALDRFANSIIFDIEGSTLSTTGSKTPALAGFSSPERAFMGILETA